MNLHAARIIHKDIKPHNVLLDTSTGEIRLIGFGLSSHLPRETVETPLPSALPGSLAYISPEQTGWMNRDVDSRSDLYSLGVALYELLTGSLPFSHEDPLELVHAHIARKAEPVDAVSEMLSDALRHPAQGVGDLASLLVRKTQGNPFFLRQFVEELAREELLTFDADAGAVVLGPFGDRAAEQQPTLRVLYISGYTDEVIAQLGVLRPGTHFLAKPFNADALARKVRETLDA